MTQKKLEFSFSESAEPHKERTKAILKDHPEVRKYIERTPLTFFIIIFTTTVQLSLAFLLKDGPWWLVLGIAYLIGAFVNHAAFVLIHECSHNLIFTKRWANILASIFADIPNILPSAVSFRAYHLKHHSFQGHYDLDADLASKWEAKLIGNSFLGKAIWELFFPVFQALRPPRLKEIQFMNVWTLLNWLVVFGLDIFIYIYWGPWAFFYLFFSFIFSIGFHPLGARWIQEHFLTAPPQETYSYYGILNIPALNVGFHNEHHDFPSIPWNNLPKLKAIAPEYYDTLVSHKSWFKLWIKFLFNSDYSLYSRMLRTNRGGIKVIN